jgi:hypothetical protein
MFQQTEANEPPPHFNQGENEMSIKGKVVAECQSLKEMEDNLVARKDYLGAAVHRIRREQLHWVIDLCDGCSESEHSPSNAARAAVNAIWGFYSPEHHAGYAKAMDMAYRTHPNPQPPTRQVNEN